MEFNKAICDNLVDQPDLDISLEQLSECYGAHFDDEISSKLAFAVVCLQHTYCIPYCEVNRGEIVVKPW